MTRIVNSDTPMCRDPQSVNAQAPLQLAGDRKGTLYEPEGHGPARQRDSSAPINRLSWSYTLTGLLTTTALVALVGAASAGPPLQVPPPVFPPPVSPLGLTSYGTFGRLAGGGGHTSFVNISSGNVLIDPVDLAMRGRGVSLVLERYYNSGDTEAGFFGLGWTSLLDARLDFCSSNDFKYRNPSGAIYHIPTNGSKTDSRIQGLHASYDSAKARIIYDNGIIFDFFSGAVGCRYYLTEIGDRNGNTITIKRDSTTGFPKTIVDKLNRTVKITPTFGRTSTISPPVGLASIVYTYTSGQLDTVTRGDQTTTYTYEPATRLLGTIRDPRGYLTRFTYQPSITTDAGPFGNRIQKIEFAREPGLSPTTFDSYAYSCPVLNAVGLPTVHATVTDPNSTVKDPHVTDYRWDPAADPGPTTITDILGRETTLTYDDFYWDVTSVSNPLQTTSKYNGGDWLGRVQELDHWFDKKDLITKYKYDAPPWPDCTNPKLSWASCALNSFLPTTITNSDNTQKSLTYNEKGNLTSITDTSNADSPAKLVTLVPNPDGTVAQIIEPGGQTTSFAYSSNFDTITVTGPLGVSKTRFDSVGRPNETISPAGKHTIFETDNLGRVTRVTYKDPTEAWFYVDLQYDGNDNLVSMDAPWGATTFTYDHRNRVVQKSSPLGSVSYTYDRVGNLTSKTDAGGTVTYDYDKVNRLKTIIDHGAVVTYDPDFYDAIIGPTESAILRAA
jgi:YD repeat-containing protein